jgi:hypothetical protein
MRGQDFLGKQGKPDPGSQAGQIGKKGKPDPDCPKRVESGIKVASLGCEVTA